MAVTASDPSAILVRKAVSSRQWLSSGKTLVTMLIIGLVFVGVGIIPIALYNGTPNTVATCNGEVMGPDDECQQYTNGMLTGTSDQQQMLASEQPNQAANYGFGIALMAIGVLCLAGAYRSRPSRPWGKPLPNTCPKCGRQALRERLMSYSVRRRRMRHTWRGRVVLCTEQCGFTTLYKPGTTLQL